jgi:hypothetical protein
VRVIIGADVGLFAEEASLFDSLPAKPNGFTLGKNLGLWEQWTRELQRGQEWVYEELVAACSARDDIEDTLALIPPSLHESVFLFLDDLDRVFRDWTVPSTHLADRQTDSRWWWGRIPLRNAQRRFLFA